MNGQLTRVREGRWIAGICGGIAKQYGWDVNLIRLVFVLVSLLGTLGIGILVYIVMWFFIPLESDNGMSPGPQYWQG
ncbi:PspC domain-containing protein [Hoyosella rhizosphaerae]|nr:PspC domain-containing protein [Hoyosella rhizosphaerae]MBN4925638.1 PspC domain-containing protein [Hoyosella rhizosphaerae]